MILLKNRDRNPSFKKGEYVEINDAGNYPMELSVDGVCKQETTTGKNLLDYVSNLITSANGLTNVINEDGSITTTGKPTSNYSTIIKTIDITDILEDGQTYTISQSTANNKIYVQMIITKDDGTYTYHNSMRGSSSFTVNKTIYKKYNITIQSNTISIWGDSPLTITNKYMLCKGTDTVDTSFEPFTGGQPSPSPDFPQNISVLTGNLKLTSCGKNLLDYVNNLITSNNGLTSVINDDGSITTTGKPTSNYSTITKMIDITDILEDGQTYTISQSTANNKIYVQMIITKDDGTYTYHNSMRGSSSFTVNKTIYKKYNITIQSNTISTWGDSPLTITNKYMLCKGTDTADTSFEPYQGSSLNITIPSNEFVGKLDDTYKDTLNVVYKDDGHYHLILNKIIGKVVLDGVTNSVTTILLHNGNYTTCHYVNNNIKILESEKTIIIANKLIGTIISKTWSGNILYSISQSTNGHYLQLCLPSIFKTSEQINNWLKDNSTIGYYILETPYEINLGIVDQLLTFDEITNIFSDSDLLPQINAKYYKDFEFDKILRSGYNIDEQEYEIAKKQMANGKRKRILSSYDDCIIKINLGLLDNKTYQEYKEQLDDGEFHYWSYKYNQYKKANFILTKPSITTEYAYDDDIGINDMEFTLEKSSDIE